MNNDSLSNRPPTAESLDRYMAAKASKEEASAASAWTKEFPDGEEAIRALHSLGVPSSEEIVPADNGWSLILESLQARVGEQEPPADIPIDTDHLSRGRLFKALRPMGAGLLALLFFVFGWQTRKQHAGKYSPSVSSSVYTTAAGKQASVVLPDGSSVMLNVASRLEVPADYDRGNRRLQLTGEAMFYVLPNEKNPFTVVTGHTTTRVLGTRFLVRKYDSDSSVLVSVRDGKVSVMSRVITRDQEIEVFSNGATDTREAVASRFNFEEGVLTFDGITLRDAVGDLNRWFEADVRLGDSVVGQRVIAGEYNMGSVASLVEILEMTLDITVIRHGRILTLYSK